MFRHSFHFLVLSIGLWSCDDSRLYEENIEFANKAWLSDSVVTINFNIPDSKKTYNLYYNIRNTASYPYHNIYVNYTLEDTVGRKLSSSLINTNLFDPKSGRPLGSGLGDVFDHQVLILENYKFDKSGEYNFKIQQYMRKDTLPEILAVGVRVETPLPADE